MGVYIPNIDKPKSCLECWSSGLSGVINCEAGTGFHNPDGDLIPSDCPLIEIDLVRCKDCKHYDTESRTFPCCTDIFGAVRYMEADGFCSKGERRADGDI